MFTKSFFKFLAGFFAIVLFGALGATFSNRYFAEHTGMLANTEQGR